MSDTDLERIERTASLARLSLEPEERTVLAPQFRAILQHFESLSEVDVSALTDARTEHGVEQGRSRPDETAAGLELDQLLRAAPDAEDGFFRVPKTIGGS